MYSDLNHKKFDVLIIGTSLCESIISSFLSKNGKKIIHMDNSRFYGGDCKNMNFREFENYKEFLQKVNSKEETYFRDSKLLDLQNYFSAEEKTREYNMDFNHKLLFAKSKATEEFANSKASNYFEFTTIKSYHIYFEGQKIGVPTNKSEIFLSEELELIEKQKLFNLLMAINKLMPVEDDLNSIDDFKKNSEVDNIFVAELNNNKDEEMESFLARHFNAKLTSLIKHVLANVGVFNISKQCTVGNMLSQINKYLTSINVYSKSPYLYPMFGSSEFSQAFCRMSSVYQGIFIINNALKIIIKRNTVTQLDSNFFVSVTDTSNNETFNIDADNIVLNECYLFPNLNVTLDNIAIKLLPQQPKFKAIWYYVIQTPVSYRNVSIADLILIL